MKYGDYHLEDLENKERLTMIMKNKNSIMIFGIGFLIVILGEAYLLNMTQTHLLSIIGIGVLVVVTGYLFFDAIWEYFTSESRMKELLRQEEVRQESEKMDSRYTELINIQKATYTALKKSDIKRQEEMNELSASLAEIIQLQKKIIEGQKKALSISINYCKEHTKELIETIEKSYKDNLLETVSTIDMHKDQIDEIDKEKVELKIKPLYDDPNATLSSDEIDKLFESYGD